MSTQRSRASTSLGNKINRIESQAEKAQTSPPALLENSVSNLNIIPNSVTNESLAPGSVDDESIKNGAVGTQNLGVVNRLTSDSNLVILADKGLILSGSNYKLKRIDYYDDPISPGSTELISNSVAMAMMPDGSIVSGLDYATVRTGFVDPYYSNGSQVGVYFYDKYWNGLSSPDSTPPDAYCEVLAGVDPLSLMGDRVVVGADVNRDMYGANNPYNKTTKWTILGVLNENYNLAPYNRMSSMSSMVASGVTLVQNTTNYAPHAIMRSTAGIVLMRGLVSSASGISAGATLYNLPQVFRPATRLDFPGISDSPGNTSYGLSVFPDGRVTISKAIAANRWVSLSHIAYPAAGVGTWVTPAASDFAAQFVDGGTAETGPVQYYVDSDGFTWWRGQVLVTRDMSAVTTDQRMVSITDPLGRPALRSYQATYSAELNSFVSTRIDSSATGLVWVANASSPDIGQTISLASVKYPTPVASTSASPATSTTPTYLNSWATFSSSTSTPAVWVRSDKISMTMGVIRSGTLASAAWNHPDGRGMTLRNLYIVTSNNAQGRADVYPTNLIPVSGSTTWMSLDGLTYSANNAI